MSRWIAGLALASVACGSDPAPRAIDLQLGEVRSAPASDRPLMLLDTPRGLLLAAREGELERLWSSADEGASWSPIAALPFRTRIWAVHPGCAELHRVEVEDRRIRHAVGVDERAPASTVARVGDVSLYGLAIDGASRLGVVWISRDRGWPEILFGQSIDHGASWSPAVRVNIESRRKELAHPVLVASGERWVVVWTENRDERTLFDLYASTSSDGRTWTPSRRLNDDLEPSFSVHPTAVVDGRAVHVASEDYRELNRWGDRDSNVYHMRFDPDGDGPAAGRRINDVTDAPQSSPSLVRDARSGALVAAWADLRDRLVGDIYASASADGGRTWSVNRRVNPNVRPELTSNLWVASRLEGGAFVLWRQVHGASAQDRIRTLSVVEASGPPPPETRLAVAMAEAPPAAARPAALVVEERFERGDLGTLRPLSGSWIVQDGALIGFDRGMAFIRWGDRLLEDLVLEGRFRLDRRQHLGAHLFLRARSISADADDLQTIHVRNHFRRGVSLARTRIALGPDAPPALVVEPLADRWFPILQDRWYDFRIVLSGSRLDYWLDGRWMLTHDGLEAGEGSIVLGVDELAPVEWDDLRLYRLESSQSASSR